MTVAIYGPVIARWYSEQGIGQLALGIAKRSVQQKERDVVGPTDPGEEITADTRPASRLRPNRSRRTTA
jgi:hypothetical protein